MRRNDVNPWEWSKGFGFSQAVVLCAVAPGPGPLSSLYCPLVNTFEATCHGGAIPPGPAGTHRHHSVDA